jgi:hypothetical protein
MPRSEGGVDGAGGHTISVLAFRNVDATSCVLSGYPVRVTLSEPGRRTITATNGSFFPVRSSRAMEPGGVTALGLETDSVCAARPDGGPRGPIYHRIRVALPDGAIGLVAPVGRAMDVGCGVHLTKFTTWR